MIRIDNARVWSGERLQQLSIVVNGEKVAALIRPEEADIFPVDSVVDANGLWILPGGIDLHAHISEADETFYRGTCCAASGGITTVFDMAPFHACITVSQLEQKTAEVEANSVIDVGLIGGIVVENSDLELMDELAEAGTAFFKVFQPAEPPVTTETIWKAVQTAARTGMRLVLHAEDPSLLLPLGDPRDPLSFPHSRPAVAETSVVAQVIDMARASGAPVHICHISTGRTAELVAWGKAHGVDVTCETTPHYLLLNETDFAVYGARVKTTPPLRTKRDSGELWQALECGIIDALISDHYTESSETLPMGAEFIPDAAAGIAGLELSLPLIMHEVLQGRLSLQRFVEVAATVPAKLAGISMLKGSILPGMDADLAFWDPNAVWVVEPAAEFSRIHSTPFAGWTLNGRVTQTWVRGKQVWDGSKIQVTPGYGRRVKTL
jgi:dihydroorotase